MERMVAFCGLVCTECADYLATQANDWAELERLAAKARAEYNAPAATAAKDMQCDGCLSGTGLKCGYCAVCEIRACGVARGVANCGHCPDYACEKLTAFFGMAPAARGVLDGVRSAL
jgi:hypothetical protein